MATSYSVQERTASTAWRTESTWDTMSVAEGVAQDLRDREPTNDNGEPMQYRVVEVQS